jgi:hypothetical protein
MKEAQAMRAIVWFCSCLLTCSLLAATLSSAQDTALPVGLIELLANPEKLDGKLVTTLGFLVVEREPKHGVHVLLYLHQEDAKNLLASNAILVIPSEQMLRDEEKINRMYVRLTGSYHAVRAANSLYPGVIKEIQSCTAWSNPDRPVGEAGTKSGTSR